MLFTANSQLEYYNSCDGVHFSDHRPVVAILSCDVKQEDQRIKQSIFESQLALFNVEKPSPDQHMQQLDLKRHKTSEFEIIEEP